MNCRVEATYTKLYKFPDLISPQPLIIGVLFFMEASEFTKEKISVLETVSNDFISDFDLKTGMVGDDFVLNNITFMLSGFIYSNMQEERDINFYFSKPTFLDWLLGRRRKSTLNIKVKQLLKKDFNIDNSEKIYLINQIE